MSLQKLITKLAIATVILVIVMLFLSSIMDIFVPVLENDLALDQFENDDWSWMQLQMFYKIKACILCVPIIPYFIFVGKNLYSYYIKSKKNYNEQ